MRAIGVLTGLLLGLGAPLGPARAQTIGASPRIANGVETAAWPEVGLFLTDQALCTVTLIGCGHALTAAHCVCDATGTGASCGGGEFLVDPTQAIVLVPQAGVLGVDTIEIPSDYVFAQQGDVAVLKLTTPVRGIRPRHINELMRPPLSTPATIVGYGFSESSDAGLRRQGAVVTTSCAVAGGVPAATNVCWNSNAPYSNTCDGDSGGPLLADLGAGLTLAGVTSGGDGSCQIMGFSFDADVFVEDDWIRQQAGVDLDTTQCGDGAQVGDAGVTTLPLAGTVTSQIDQSFQVTPGTKLLRVGLNGAGAGDADLYVGPFVTPTPTSATCASAFAGSFEYCEIPDPAPATWHALVTAAGGAVDYQLTVTLLPEDPAPPPLAPGWMVTTSFNGDELIEVDPVSANRALASSSLRGTGPDLAAPEGLALDRDGSVLVASPAGLSLLRIDPASGDRVVVSGCADSGCSSTVGAGPAFFAPRFVALAPDRTVWVADRSDPGLYAIMRVDPSTGNRTVVSGCANSGCSQVVGGGPAIARLFGIRLDASGTPFVVDGQALYRIDPTTGLRTLVSGCVDAGCTTSVGSGPLAGQPADLVIDGSGALYVTYRIEGTPFGALRRVDATTGDRSSVSGCDDAACASARGSGPAFIDPFGIAFDLDGSLLVADGGLETVVRIDPATGDRTPRSGCADASCSAALGTGPGFADVLGIAVVPEPAEAPAAWAVLAALAVTARARRRS